MKKALPIILSFVLSAYCCFAMPSDESIKAAEAWFTGHVMAFLSLVITGPLILLLRPSVGKFGVRLLLFMTAAWDVFISLYALSTLRNPHLYTGYKSSEGPPARFYFVMDICVLWLGAFALLSAYRRPKR